MNLFKIMFLLMISLNVNASVRIIYFYSAGCGACQDMSPRVLELSQELNIPVVPNTFDENSKHFPNSINNKELIRHFNVMYLPAIAMVDDNKKIGDLIMVGAHEKQDAKEKILEWIKLTRKIGEVN